MKVMEDCKNVVSQMFILGFYSVCLTEFDAGECDASGDREIQFVAFLRHLATCLINACCVKQRINQIDDSNKTIICV